MNRQSLKRIVVASMVAGAAAVALPRVVSAYSYSMSNNSGQTINHIHFHTVSAFCKNKDWSGSWTKDQGVLTVDDQSGCLVDSITATDTNGKSYGWSGLGVGNTSWSINDDGTIK
jgi:hypothetical protein